MTQPQTTQYFRAELAARRATLRLAFADYRKVAAKLAAQGLVSYNTKAHTFGTKPQAARSLTAHQITILETFLTLQRELQEQAWLLTELEYTIDEQEKTNRQT